jgi:hypothetical protein
MKNVGIFVALSAFFAVVLFIGGMYGLERYLKANKFGEEMQAAAKLELAKAAEDLSFLPTDGVYFSGGVAKVDNYCYTDRNFACSEVMKMVPKEPCANKMQLVASSPLACNCSGNCGEKYPWSCEVKWSFICDVNAECAKHSDCPGKGMICRERRCVQYE